MLYDNIKMKKLNCNTLQIKNLSINVGDKTILKNLNLKINKGEVLAVVGPNGAGKSSLFKTIMHHYAFKITNGEIVFNQKKIHQLETNEIAQLGFYYLSQNPLELEGIKLLDLYKSICKVNNLKYDPFDLYNKVTPLFRKFNMDLELLERNSNVSFSGGQKKKNEIIQMSLLNPKVLLLDEIDSGCDIDSLKTIAKEINKLKKDKIILLITHQKNLIKMIKPNKYILINNQKIAQSGDGKDLLKILEKGFTNPNKKPINGATLKNVF